MSPVAVDTSVVVPALLAAHEDHERCRVAAHGAAIPAHVLIESYSVLTRLPSGHRLSADVAGDLLGRWFPEPRVLVAAAGLQRTMVRRLHRAGISAGATFDGVVALTAAAHDLTLVTRDGRAVRTYAALGASYKLLEPAG